MTEIDRLKELAERIESAGFSSGSQGLAALREALQIIADELDSLSTKKKEKKP